MDNLDRKYMVMYINIKNGGCGCGCGCNEKEKKPRKKTIKELFNIKINKTRKKK